MDDFEEDFPGQAEEIRRQQVLEKAVEKADRIICEGADGDTALLTWFTTVLAEKFAYKAAQTAGSVLLRQDLEKRLAK